MPYSEKLAARVRAGLAHMRDVKERKMFGGIAFMVKGKMCVTVGKDRIMCRIDPDSHDAAIRRKGARTMTMGEREYRGYVRVQEDALTSKSQLDYWLRLSLAFNKNAKASGRRRNT